MVWSLGEWLWLLGPRSASCEAHVEFREHINRHCNGSLCLSQSQSQSRYRLPQRLGPRHDPIVFSSTKVLISPW